MSRSILFTWILLLSLVAFTILYVFLVRVRMDIESTEAALEQRGELLSAGA